MFPWAPQAALAGRTAGRRAVAAARLALSFLLLEDDHEVDWEVDWDQSAEREPRPAGPAAPSYDPWLWGHRPSAGRRYRGQQSRRQGQLPPRLQPCMADVAATSPPTARARHRCETPRSAAPPCRREVGDARRRDRGVGR
jgi:hypothetical protein